MAIGLATDVIKVWKIAMAVGLHKWAEAMTLVIYIYIHIRYHLTGVKF